MEKGLLYLNLFGCNLKNLDLGKFSASPHQSTLRELNLYGNSFEYDNSGNLIRLCQNLISVQVLDLGGNYLETWPISQIIIIFDCS